TIKSVSTLGVHASSSTNGDLHEVSESIARVCHLSRSGARAAKSAVGNGAMHAGNEHAWMRGSRIDSAANLLTKTRQPYILGYRRRAGIDSRSNAHDRETRLDADASCQCFRSRCAAIDSARWGQILLHELVYAHGSP